MSTLNRQLQDAFSIFEKAKTKLEKVVINCERLKDDAIIRMEDARIDIEISGDLRRKAVNSIQKINEIMGTTEG